MGESQLNDFGFYVVWTRRVRYWGILRPETEAALRKRDDYMSTRD